MASIHPILSNSDPALLHEQWIRISSEPDDRESQFLRHFLDYYKEALILAQQFEVSKIEVEFNHRWQKFPLFLQKYRFNPVLTKLVLDLNLVRANQSPPATVGVRPPLSALARFSSRRLAVTQILPLLHQQADYHHQLYPDYYQNVPDIDWSRYRQNTRRDITNAKNIHHFFRQNSHVSGLILGGIKYDRAYIWELVVDQSLRGQGVGTQLILRFIKSAQSRRAETIIVETGHNQPAIHLYQRLGFAPHQHIWFQNL